MKKKASAFFIYSKILESLKKHVLLNIKNMRLVISYK